MNTKNKEKLLTITKILEEYILEIDSHKKYTKLTIELNFANGIMDSKIKIIPQTYILV